MNKKEDKSISSSSIAKSNMIVTSAEGFHGTVFISKTYEYSILKIINVRKDGTKCEFVCSEHDLRAARKAINLFAEESNWDREVEE